MRAMRILLNGQERDFPGPQTVSSVLAQTGQAERRVAVEVNREIVPRSQHAGFALSEGDRVEIIQAIGGG